MLREDNVRRHLGDCGWFWVWAVVGGSVAISCISSIGGWFLPLAVIGVVAARRWGRAAFDKAVFGAVTGAGVPLLLVAYINRDAPDVTYVDPRPWFEIGMLLVVAGIAGFVYVRRRAA